MADFDEIWDVDESDILPHNLEWLQWKNTRRLGEDEINEQIMWLLWDEPKIITIPGTEEFPDVVWLELWWNWTPQPQENGRDLDSEIETSNNADYADYAEMSKEETIEMWGRVNSNDEILPERIGTAETPVTIKELENRENTTALEYTEFSSKARKNAWLS